MFDPQPCLFPYLRTLALLSWYPPWHKKKTTEIRSFFLVDTADRFCFDTQVRFAVERDGIALRHASTELRDDPEIVKLAVANNGASIDYASERLKQASDTQLFSGTNSFPFSLGGCPTKNGPSPFPFFPGSLN